MKCPALRGCPQLDAITDTAAEQLGAPLYFAFHSGRPFQNAIVDTAFNLLPIDPQGIGDLAFLLAHVFHFGQATEQIAPSSIGLASELVDPLIHQQVNQVLEFGPGTGL